MCRTKEPPIAVDTTEKTLVVYGFDNRDVFQSITDKYIVKNPYVRISYKQFSSFEDYEKLILDKLAEGVGPDIFAMPNSWFVKNKNKLSPMPEKLGTTDVFKSLFVDVASNDLIITDNTGTERVYGVPLYVDTLALYYNKDHFEDRLPGTGKPSATWDGIKNDVFMLSKSKPDSLEFDVAGIAMGLSSNVTYATDILYGLLMENGASFYDSLMSKSILSNAFAALDIYTSFASPAQKNYSWNEHMGDQYDLKDISAFASSEVSMIFGYSDTYDKIVSERVRLKGDGKSMIPLSSIKVAPFPQVEDPASSTSKRYTYASYDAYTVSRNSKNSDAAWDFLTFLATPEVQKSYFANTHRPTSLRSLISSQKMDASYGVFVDQVGYAESFPVLDVMKFEKYFLMAIDEVNAGKSARNVLTGIESLINLQLPVTGYRVPVKKLEEVKK